MTVSSARAGVRSLSLAFPSVLRTNDFYRAHYPDLVAQAEQHTLAKIWSKRSIELAQGEQSTTRFEIAMTPYLSDPFRGAVERRIRGPRETSLSMESEAARGALAAASLGVDDIDLTLVSALVGDKLGVGDAAYVAKELGLSRSPAWNYESACAGSVVGLHMASNLVAAGGYRRVLVVCCTSNSVQVKDDDTVGWFLGDGAAAFVVEAANPGFGVLGWKTINTLETNDMFVIHAVADGDKTRLLTAAHPNASAMAREPAERYLRTCVDGALQMAGVSAKDVDFWLFPTPSAWYADFCARVLEVDENRYHSVYPRYANIGMTLMPATLYHAIAEKRVRPGDLVVAYGIGSSSTASALVMRVGEIALGEAPKRPEVQDGLEGGAGQ